MLLLEVVAATDVVQESYCCHTKKKMKRNTNTLVHTQRETQTYEMKWQNNNKMKPPEAIEMTDRRRIYV